MTPRWCSRWCSGRRSTTCHPDPVRLLETLLALGVQLLIADNPELLLHPTRRLALARNAVALIRETHYAIKATPSKAEPASE